MKTNTLSRILRFLKKHRILTLISGKLSQQSRQRLIDFMLLACAVAALVVFLVSLSGSAGFAGAAFAMAGVVIPGSSGGRHVVDGPLTTSLASEASPDLLLNEIDRRITRIRPSATPIDQISRMAGARPAGAMVVDYYSVDTKPSQARITTGVDEEDADGINRGCAVVYKIATDNDAIFEPSETLLLPDEKGHDQNPLVLYVVSRPADGGLMVSVVNGRPDPVNPNLKRLNQIKPGSLVVRMGRAAGELDVQTPQFNALPTKATNYCQIFKSQVEESTFQKIANKEVGWSFTDQEEVAIVDMRMGMERNFLFGQKARVLDPEKGGEAISLTGGIWAQAGGEYTYYGNTPETDFIVGLTRKAFTGQAGSKRKVLVGGSDLIDYINRFSISRVAGAEQVTTHWGIDFRELHSKFGTLYVIHSEVFDACGHSADGMVIDPEYLTKYSHVPFRTERLDLKKSGVRNTNAVVITEASCLVLRYPNAHLRVVCKGKTAPKV